MFHRSYILAAGYSALALALRAAPSESGSGRGARPGRPADEPASGATTTVIAAAPSAPAGPGEAMKGDAEIIARVGGTPIPGPAGGAGVGANQLATEAAAIATVGLDHAGEVDRYLAGRVSAGAILANQREHFRTLAATPEGFETVRKLFPVATPSARTFDPDEVPGTHVLRALTSIHHDGTSYAPGDEVELGFRSYEELVAIGAVAPIDWATGEPVRIRS